MGEARQIRREENAMADHQITCIVRQSPGTSPEHITEVGLVSGPRMPVRDVITAIKAGTHTYFVVGGGQRAVVTVATRDKKEYIRTKADSTGKDNLLALPNCR
jgi:hypothetical protein